MAEDSGEIAELLQQWVKGDKEAFGAMVPLVYGELRRLAHDYLRSESAGHTLQSTALVNEACLLLLGDQPVEVRNRSHFVAVAARLMRQILVDHARKRQALKRGGGLRVDVSAVAEGSVNDDLDLVALDDALQELGKLDERLSNIVDLKFFGGLSAAEISEALGISRATIDRDWATARVWLHRQMKMAPPG